MKIKLGIKEAQAYLQDYFESKLETEDVIVIIDDGEALKNKILNTVRGMAKGGDKIGAIKYMRSISDDGLVESKKLVEDIMENDDNSIFIHRFEINKMDNI